MLGLKLFEESQGLTTQALLSFKLRYGYSASILSRKAQLKATLATLSFAITWKSPAQSCAIDAPLQRHLEKLGLELFFRR